MRLAAVLLLFAVNAHAATVYLGKPFASDGSTWVPIMGSNLPNDLISVGNLGLVFTGAGATDDDSGGHFGNVWPNTWPKLPTCFTQVYDSGTHVSASYSNFFCDLSASRGMLGAFRVTGTGTVRLEGDGAWAFDCEDNRVSLTVAEGVASFGRRVWHEVGIGFEVKVPEKTGWGRLKAMYR